MHAAHPSPNAGENRLLDQPCTGRSQSIGPRVAEGMSSSDTELMVPVPGVSSASILNTFSSQLGLAAAQKLFTAGNSAKPLMFWGPCTAVPFHICRQHCIAGRWFMSASITSAHTSAVMYLTAISLLQQHSTFL